MQYRQLPKNPKNLFESFQRSRNLRQARERRFRQQQEMINQNRQQQLEQKRRESKFRQDLKESEIRAQTAENLESLSREFNSRFLRNRNRIISERTQRLNPRFSSTITNPPTTSNTSTNPPDSADEVDFYTQVKNFLNYKPNTVSQNNLLDFKINRKDIPGFKNYIMRQPISTQEKINLLSYLRM